MGEVLKRQLKHQLILGTAINALMSKKNKEIKYTTHHILPRSRLGSNEKQNLVELREGYHQAIHQLFANKMIAQQLITTLDISSKALRPDVKEWLLEVLNSKDILDPYEWYKEEVIR